MAPVSPLRVREWRDRFATVQKQPGLWSIAVPGDAGMFDARALMALSEILMPFGDNVLRLTTDRGLRIRNILDAFVPHMVHRLGSALPGMNVIHST
jgi:hypothetical protein